MAMAAFVQADNENKIDSDRKQDELRMVIKATNAIAGRRPESDKANETRMILGGMCTSAKTPVEAGDWFSKVPGPARTLGNAGKIGSLRLVP